MSQLIGLTYISIVFYIVLFASMLQHILLNANYFQERFALFLVPLFFFNFLNCCLYTETINFKWNYAFKSIAFVSTIGAVFIFVFAYNTNSTLFWSYDSCTKKMLTDLKQETKQFPNKSYTLGITWVFEPTINFYRQTHLLNWLQEVNRDGVNNNYDYYYVDINEKIDSIKNKIILIKNYPELNTSLYKKIN